MKYRIVQTGSRNFEVERRRFFSRWERCSMSGFDTALDAKAYIKSLIERRKKYPKIIKFEDV
jgi:hypothetical protein